MYKKQLAEAEASLLFSQFQDMLSGTMIKQTEIDGMRLMDYGSEIVLNAFFAIEGKKYAVSFGPFKAKAFVGDD